jgi:hypothetical protein
MTETARIVTRIDLDTATANGAASFTDPDFVALCDRFESLLEAECARLGFEVEVVRDGRTSGAHTTRGYGAAERDAHDIVNACWDRALAG